MSRHMCQSCGTYFDSGHFAPMYCNVCTQTKAMQKAQDQQSRALEEQQRQARIASENNARMIAAAEYDRAEAIREQNVILMENAVSDSSVYKRGYDYIDNEWNSSNPANLKVMIREDKRYTWTNNSLYKSQRLNNKFAEGLKDKLKKEMVYDVNKIQNSLKHYASILPIILTDDNYSMYPTFELPTGFTLRGNELETPTYKKTLMRTVNEKDGSVSFTWSDHFADPELNELFDKGIYNCLEFLNSEEYKKKRLKNEVRQIKKQRKEHNTYRMGVKFLDFLFTLTILAIAFLSFIFVLGFTSGWWTILAMSIPIWVWIFGRECQNAWRTRFFGILEF